ncbi:MAG TPA: dihydroorotate dehydrogenase electron transfer subunit [Vicinamibacteria bacterium]|jgi:dihydroorotate dehydrogenase electron transfer subunit|nr:dihydroorotate dehydrogenase electron transfer subunit [Vicinamibacteria bacterium]
MPADEPAPLLAREPLEGAYVLLTFRHAETARAARAGQFVMIKAGTSPELPLRRPFSVMSVDRARQTFTLFLKAVGPGSRALAGLRVGEVAQCLGPLGRSFPPPGAGEEALLVAGGYGIAPFRLFCEELGTGPRARVFYGGRTGHDLQLRDRFADLKVPLLPATEDGSVGHRGRVTSALEAYLDGRPGPVRLYACGPPAMLQAVASLAGERGLEASVSLDPWMGCGLGTCLSCVVWTQEREEPRPHYRCACTEGPVFDAKTVVWPGEVTSLARRRPERSPA